MKNGSGIASYCPGSAPDAFSRLLALVPCLRTLWWRPWDRKLNFRFWKNPGVGKRPRASLGPMGEGQPWNERLFHPRVDKDRILSKWYEHDGATDTTYPAAEDR